MSKNDAERLYELESEVTDLRISVDALTKSVTSLNEIISQGKGALKMFLILASAAASITGVAAWLAHNITFRGP